MGILDDIKMSKMQARHPVEDNIFDIVLGLLENRIIKREYDIGAYDLYSWYYIRGFLAKVTYKNGVSEYQLLEEDGNKNWQRGEYSIGKNSNIINIDTHPFSKLDEEYIKSKLPKKITERIGGGCSVYGCSCFQLRKEKKKLFSKYDEYIEKYSVYIEVQWPME